MNQCNVKAHIYSAMMPHITGTNKVVNHKKGQGKRPRAQYKPLQGTRDEKHVRHQKIRLRSYS